MAKNKVQLPDDQREIEAEELCLKHWTLLLLTLSNMTLEESIKQNKHA